MKGKDFLVGQGTFPHLCIDISYKIIIVVNLSLNEGFWYLKLKCRNLRAIFREEFLVLKISIWERFTPFV